MLTRGATAVHDVFGRCIIKGTPGFSEQFHFFMSELTVKIIYRAGIDIRAMGYHFIKFLRELRSGLPAWKKLSVAVPARTELITDAYKYARIAPIVDRMVIMAYDDHWSTSSPGPVASLPFGAYFEYAENVVVTVFYDDQRSIMEKLQL